MRFLTRMLAATILAATFLRPDAVGARPISAADAGFRNRAEAIISASYRADEPGAAVVVTRRGHVIFSAERGLARLEPRDPVRPGTVFHLGSITKQFTAAVILQLAGEGRISLDDTVSRFFPDYPQPGARATVRQLLSHTSGIRSYHTIREWIVPENFGREHSTAEMIAVARDYPSPTQPGEAFAYNNSGYVLLGGIIETVTGKPWHQAIVERAARPLGLTTIAYGETVRSDPSVAHGYRAGEEGQRPAIPIHLSVPHAAGGLVSSTLDLARWSHALHHGRIVPPALYRQMIQPTALPHGATRNYGFAMRLERLRGHQTLGHGGGVNGFVSESIYVPSADLYVAVLANSESPRTRPEMLARRLAALALGVPYPSLTRAEVDPATLEPLLGVYRFPGEAAELRFFTRGGRLLTKRDGGRSTEIIPAGQNRFYYEGSLDWLELRPGPGGAAEMLFYDAREQLPATGSRVGPVPADPAEVPIDQQVLRTYVGSYSTAGPPIVVALNAEGRLTVAIGGRPPLNLRAVSQTEFRIENTDARILFHAEGDRVNRITLKEDGNDDLPGRRSEP